MRPLLLTTLALLSAAPPATAAVELTFQRGATKAARVDRVVVDGDHVRIETRDAGRAVVLQHAAGQRVVWRVDVATGRRDALRPATAPPGSAAVQRDVEGLMATAGPGGRARLARVARDAPAVAAGRGPSRPIGKRGPRAARHGRFTCDVWRVPARAGRSLERCALPVHRLGLDATETRTLASLASLGLDLGLLGDVMGGPGGGLAVDVTRARPGARPQRLRLVRVRRLAPGGDVPPEAGAR